MSYSLYRHLLSVLVFISLGCVEVCFGREVDQRAMAAGVTRSYDSSCVRVWNALRPLLLSVGFGPARSSTSPGVEELLYRGAPSLLVGELSANTLTKEPHFNNAELRVASVLLLFTRDANEACSVNMQVRYNGNSSTSPGAAAIPVSTGILEQKLLNMLKDHP